ncbi:GIY-YIG nuclease family protein [Sulfitobacter albidus]|uniref:GIY-YIG nuclease family protein n=1 Tax=Sulfitobacter albidus TaxID=2829501 RepID=A0A975JGI5_9RHOB|nr:GIY-YIG nuclease family protein [Sulfitobacter albidus]QUJ77845.1 GIY-YIG nuclease family protein [Sulfitobacter albidus]
MRARSLELFFIDGLPDGMLTAEVFNWTGHVLRFPRTRLREALTRPEAARTGVYVLLGDGDDGPLAYIGEAETLSERMRNHAAQKDWWETAILIGTTGDLLQKVHAKYIESRLVENGMLMLDGAHAVFQSNHAFSSPSAAGAVINGRSTNGRTAWRHRDTGQTYAEWEADQLNEAAP